MGVFLNEYMVIVGLFQSYLHDFLCLNVGESTDKGHCVGIQEMLYFG